MDVADLDAFRDWLASQLTGETVAPSGPLLPTPDRQVAAMDYDDAAQSNWHGVYLVNIRCRSLLPGPGVNPYRNGHELADKVVTAVAPPQDNDLVIDLNGRPAKLKRRSGPLSLGPDDKGRWEFTINAALEVSRV